MKPFDNDFDDDFWYMSLWIRRVFVIGFMFTFIFFCLLVAFLVRLLVWVW